MKKFLFVLLSLMVIFSAQASAEKIKIEGEDYSEATFTPTIKEGFDEFSGSKFLQSWVSMEKDATYSVTYKVNSDKKGGYSLSGVTTYLLKGWTTDYTIIVNGKEILTPAEDATLTKHISSSSYKDLFAHYDLGLIHLEKGENTITFKAENSDLRSDGILIMWIDYFELEEVPFGIFNLTPYCDLGVFERKDNVEYSIDLVSECEENMTLPFEVKNFWRQTVLKGNISALKGKDKIYLNLGKLDTGWYSIDVTCAGEKKTAWFTVTHNENEYYDGDDSPFAMDFASDNTLKNATRDREKYIRAAKLAGIHWLRERWSWGSFNTAEDVYNTNVDVSQTKYGMIHDAGIKTSVAYTESPAYSIERGHYPADFFVPYWSYYYAAKTYGDSINMWECWNEEDTAFASEPADVYAAMMKATAIGVADAGVDSAVCVGGFAMAADETTFMDLCMQNGLMDYTAAYNCHVYGHKNSQEIVPGSSVEELETHLNLVYTYGDTYDTPVWVTEGGMARTIPTGQTGMTWEGQKEVAAGVAIGMTQSVARGTAKHYWFVLGPYSETVNDFGVFCKNNEPYTTYAAYANYVYQLGKGDYKGKMSGLPEGAEGHIFNNGDHDVAIVWSEKESTIVPISSSDLKVADLMGVENKVAAGQEIHISKYPIYIHFVGDADESNYLPTKRNVREITPQHFTDVQKLVMCQRFYGTNYNTPRTSGYEITGGGYDNKFELEVYNFSDKTMTATITATPESDGYVLENPTQTITVAAKTCGVLNYNIKTTDNIKYDVTEYLRFDGVVDGEAMSPSVSRIIARTPFAVEPDGIFPKSTDAKYMYSDNVGEGGLVHMSNREDGSILLDTEKISEWAYPLCFDVDDASMLEGTTGICFDVERLAEFTAYGMNVFVDYSDGRRYFLGNDNMMDVLTKQYVIPWTKFIMFDSPFGVAVDTRTFDPTLIAKVEIGGNIRGTINGKPKYAVSNFGWYTAEGATSSAESFTVDIEGVTDGAVYKAGEIPTVTATWSEELKYEKIGVKLGSEEYTNFTVDGNKMTIDLSGLERGQQRLMVYMSSSMDYVYKDTVRFDVE